MPNIAFPPRRKETRALFTCKLRALEGKNYLSNCTSKNRISAKDINEFHSRDAHYRLLSRQPPGYSD